MSALLALLRKEATDIVRDLRLSIFALAYALVTGLIASAFVANAVETQQAPGGVPPNALAIAGPLGFVNMLFVLILAGTFVLDAVGRERDEGMLGLLLTTRATAGAVLAAKVVLAFLAYAALAALGLVSASILATSMGPSIAQAVLLILVGPMLVLFVFLLGSGLLLSVLLPSARIALGVGLALSFLLFLIGATPIFSALLTTPWLRDAIAWTPFAVASEAQGVLLGGGATPWAHELGVLAAGLACLAAAWLVFRRKEVAQG